MGHGDGFGGDWCGSPHGWLVLLGFAFPMGFFIYFFLILVFVPMGFWWVVGKGGYGGGVVVVTGQWRCDDRG